MDQKRKRVGRDANSARGDGNWGVLNISGTLIRGTEELAGWNIEDKLLFPHHPLSHY